MEQLNPTQNIAIDLIILGFDKENEVVKLYAPERDLDFLKGKRALPGVLLKHGESISDAVERTITTCRSCLPKPTLTETHEVM